MPAAAPAAQVGSVPGTPSISTAKRVDAGTSREDVLPPDEVGSDLRNDDFASAYTVRGLPFTSRTTEPSSRQPDEPTDCSSSGGTRWFRYTPRFDIDLLATTTGSGLGTAVGVFTGISLSTLRSAACAADPGGRARLSFPARAGTPYWFQVAKTIDGGPLVFDLAVQSRTFLASGSPDNGPATGGSGRPRISADGRYVVFHSTADLVPGTQNGCVAVRRPALDVFAVPRPGPCLNVYRRDLTTNTTELVSTGDGEVGGDNDSYSAVVSADGRFVAFISAAANLISKDTNGTPDAFLRDMTRRETTRVYVTSTGQQVVDPDGSIGLAISSDGRFVAFSSQSEDFRSDVPAGCAFGNCYLAYVRDVQMGRTHLASADEDGDPLAADCYVNGLSGDGSRIAYTSFPANDGRVPQVVISDWRTPGRTEIVSVSTEGAEGNGTSRSFDGSAISDDGRFVVFLSSATDLIDDEDTNEAVDTFVRDLVLNRTVRVSVSSSGTESQPPQRTDTGQTLTASNGIGFDSSSISPDGRYVTFASEAPDLVSGDDNGTYDVFVHDLRRRTTTRVSLLDDGSQSAGISYASSISAGGGRIAFMARGFRPEDDGTNFVVYVRQQPPS
ncbi:MAG TPA: hypothetical protein VNB94_05615 [Mycobacteriales bacterium]|nr:hypothetical protein [Mycobacteriales bacterium]